MKGGREVILGGKVFSFFNNWELRDSPGMKITAVCHSRAHKPKSNGVAPTSATPGLTYWAAYKFNVVSDGTVDSGRFRDGAVYGILPS